MAGGELDKSEERSGDAEEYSGQWVCDEDPVPRIPVTNCLQRIGSKPITFENSFPPEKSGISIAKAGKVC